MVVWRFGGTRGDSGVNENKISEDSAWGIETACGLTGRSRAYGGAHVNHGQIASLASIT